MFKDNESRILSQHDPLDHVITPERIKQDRAAVIDFLQSEGVDISYAESLRVEDKSQYLIDCLIKNDYLQDSFDQELELDDENVGLVIIKPEILPYATEVVNFLHHHGFEAQLLEQIRPSKKTWLETYGYMLKKHPDVINIYITQCALGVQPVIFQHLNLSDYEEINLDIVRNSDYDKDKIFDTLFCGEVEDVSRRTLRGAVSLSAMRQLGFDDFTNYASSFDPVGYFKGAPSITYKAFNGVHIPSDRSEKQKNMQSFTGWRE